MYKANNVCLRAGKQILMGSSQATPSEDSEDTTKLIKTKVLDDELGDERCEEPKDSSKTGDDKERSEAGELKHENLAFESTPHKRRRHWSPPQVGRRCG